MIVMMSLLALVLGAYQLFYLYKFGQRYVGLTCLFVLWLVAAMGWLFYVIADHFSGAGVNEAVIFHLAVLTDINVLMQFWPWVLLAITGLGAAFAAMFVAVKLLGQRDSIGAAEPLARGSLNLAVFSVFVSLVVQPIWQDLWRVLEARYDKRGVAEFEQLFVIPDNVIAPLRRPNLVYIYLESLDQWFFDEQRFPGLLPNLQSLRSSAIQFTNVAQLDKTGWTIAGIVTSQCGVPLVNGVRKKLVQTREPLCLGDILQQAGYKLHFLGGADHSFAGKGFFFRKHGYDVVKGRLEFEQLESGLENSIWGIYDDDLLRFAWQELQELPAYSPFVLSFLTLDTHPPNGHSTPVCRNMHYQGGENKMLNAMHCTDKLVGEFIQRVLADERLKDTVIVVASDHLLVNKAGGFVVDANDKTNTFFVINAPHEEVLISRQATTLDIAPSLLHILGFDIYRLGFGRNLFVPKPTLIEIYGHEELNRLLNAWFGVVGRDWSPAAEH